MQAGDCVILHKTVGSYITILCNFSLHAKYSGDATQTALEERILLQTPLTRYSLLHSIKEIQFFILALNAHNTLHSDMYSLSLFSIITQRCSLANFTSLRALHYVILYQTVVSLDVQSWKRIVKVSMSFSIYSLLPSLPLQCVTYFCI